MNSGNTALSGVVGFRKRTTLERSWRAHGASGCRNAAPDVTPPRLGVRGSLIVTKDEVFTQAMIWGSPTEMDDISPPSLDCGLF